MSSPRAGLHSPQAGRPAAPLQPTQRHHGDVPTGSYDNVPSSQDYDGQKHYVDFLLDRYAARPITQPEPQLLHTGSLLVPPGEARLAHRTR
jgi:hypothetical protein